ncbi:keratocan-like [Zingiber officinale]|uniref:keratocan-like n=1 Tax=Zingiber officinale TaxID=94328 RepID=UPI001C4C692F|nr:keratocan-like [Zingiber officinale]
MLILRNNIGLKAIPSSLFTSIPHLTYLDLGFCGISELSMEIGSLTELQYLDFSFNPVAKLPAELGCLCKLEYLFLSSTCLKIVPNGTISNLLMLKWLDISNNPLVPKWWWDELKSFKGGHQLSVRININATTDNIQQLNMLPNVSIWGLTLDGKNISKHEQVMDLSTPQWGCRVSDKLEILNIVSRIMQISVGCRHGSGIKFWMFKASPFSIPRTIGRDFIEESSTL